jgi:hypothetical protein
MLIECFVVVTVCLLFDEFLYFTCGLSDLVGRRIALAWGVCVAAKFCVGKGEREPKHVAEHR